MRKYIDLTKVLKVGQKVWGSCTGWVIVNEIRETDQFPIVCNNGATYTNNATYTNDGRGNIMDKYPTLFLDEQLPNFTYEPEPDVDFSKLPHNVKCIVSDYSDFTDSDVRYFSDYLPLADNKFVCYGDGHNNKTSTIIIQWKYCKIHPDVEIKDEWLK